MKTQKDLIGYYDKHGYTIETVSPISGILYRADKLALNSQQDGTSTEHQLPLDTIRDYCEQTGRNMAEEQGVKFQGTQLRDD